MRRSWLWYLVPMVALLELGGQLLISARAVSPVEWAAIRSPVRKLARPGDVLVVAPRWAEPLARHVLGDEWWPLADLTRADEHGVARVVEISLLGATDPSTESWPSERELNQGPFRFTVRTNPHYAPALFSLVESVLRAEPAVFRRHEGTRHDCSWKQNLAPSTGGLHGHVAFPSARYVCGRGEQEFVGVTLIDDAEFQPRRCVWVHAPSEGEQWLSLDDVALGQRLEGHVGSSYFLMRDGTRAPIELEVFIDGSLAGKVTYKDDEGWSHFAFPTPKSRGHRGRLEFKISTQEAGGRAFCLAAETR